MAKKKTKWVDIPRRDWSAWLSDFIVSSMVLKGWEMGGKKMPKRIRLSDPCIKENKDGSGTLAFEVDY